jgi:hypothetical protein
MPVGRYVFGIASIVAGVLDLIWGEFESAHQPIVAWGEHIAGVTIMAYIAALWLILGGAAMLSERTAAAGAFALAVLYVIFAGFSLPRFVTAPHYLGYNPATYIGVAGSVAQQLILAVAAWATLSGNDLSPANTRIARWIFGLCSIDFGLAHLTGVDLIARSELPVWTPLGGQFWVVLTGVAFVLAGIGIISGFLDVLAAKLLGLMLLVFGVVLLTPGAFAAPHDHTSWGGDAYNLTAVGAAWIFAAWLAAVRQSSMPYASRVSARL